MPEGLPEVATDLCQDDYLTTDQVAALLQVSRRVLNEWVVAGTGPPCLQLTSKLRRFRRAHVHAWADAHLKGDSTR